MASSRRHGRRDNGLDAAAFRALRDVDPRVGEHLLDVLREADIAAYLDPTSDVDAVTRSIALPSPPSDRLFVDRNLSEQARTLLREYDSETPETGESDADQTLRQSAAPPSSPADDALWRELVAQYEADHGRLGDTLTDDFDQVAKRRAQDQDEARKAASDDSEAEEHYEPPVPPPLPILSRGAAYALMMLAGGALLLVAPGTVGLRGDLGFIFGVLSIAAGVGMLIWRMREGPAYENPDDGAIV